MRPRRLLLALLALAALAAAAPGAGAAGERPNVLLVLTDDQRWDTLGAMPAVRRELVGRGVTFTEAVAVNPLCCPSRATILTGRYSHSTGVYRNEGPYGGAGWFDDSSTVATWLRAAGYRTAWVGKYLNGYGDWRPPSLGHWFEPPGWDVWLPAEGGYFDYSARVHGVMARFERDADDYSTDVLAREALAFVEETRGPFFLVFAPYAPHGPAKPAPRHASAFAELPPWRPPSYDERDVRDKPGWLRARPPLAAVEEAETDAFRRRQLASLRAVDEAVAALLASLRADGRLDDTLVVLASDNGLLWGEHRLAERKMSVYEESVRIPLVVRYDRLVAGPRADGRLVANVDLAPTFADAAGIEAPGAEGRSLLPLLGPRGGTERWRRYVLVERLRRGDDPAAGGPTYCAVRGERFKYVVYSTGEEELYDLDADPYELENLAARPAGRARLPLLRAELLRRCRPAPPGLDLGRLGKRQDSSGPANGSR